MSIARCMKHSLSQPCLISYTLPDTSIRGYSSECAARVLHRMRRYDFFQLPDINPDMLTHSVEVRIRASYQSNGYGEWAAARPQLLLLKVSPVTRNLLAKALDLLHVLEATAGRPLLGWSNGRGTWAAASPIFELILLEGGASALMLPGSATSCRRAATWLLLRHCLRRF